jgi:hypothetical protein
VKKLTVGVLTAVLLNGWIAPVLARAGYSFFNPSGSFAIEVSLEDPPHNLKRLPIYQNSIASLAVIGDHIIGGTSAKPGLGPYVFAASLSKRTLTHLLALEQVIPGQRSIQSGFCQGKNNALYAGTIANQGQDTSGHLIEIKISSNGAIHAADLGEPVHGEGIFALTCDAERSELYGISYPSGFFFKHNIKTGHTQIYRNTAPSAIDLHAYHEYALKPQDYLSKALIADKKGRVYGSKPIDRIFYYDPKSDAIHVLPEPIPFVWGRDILGRVDAWAQSKDGLLYGGNGGDGQLFRLDPSTGKVTNLGKPIMMDHLKALAFGGDGKLYGIAGGPPGYAHLFTYTHTDGFFDLGNPQFRLVAPGIEQGIAWRGFQIGTLATSPDGKYMVMGEDESLSQLMVFPITGR